MQERLHIDELKRIEKQVNMLVKSWQKLSKDHAQLEEKYANLQEKVEKLKISHQEQIAALEQRHDEAEQAAKEAFDVAIADENQRWQQKYDETCATHEAQVREIENAHHNELHALQLEMVRKEQALTKELAQVKKVKDALSNRVLGVAE